MRKIQHLVVIESIDDHGIDFDGGEARFLRCGDPAKHIVQVPAPRDLRVLVSVHGIQTDVEPGDAGVENRLRVFRKQDAVGCQTDVLEAFCFFQIRGKFNKTAADQRLAAGQPHLDKSQGHRPGNHAENLLVPENIVMTFQRNPFHGAAVYAAQITAVGDGNPKIIDVPVVCIQHEIKPVLL